MIRKIGDEKWVGKSEYGGMVWRYDTLLMLFAVLLNAPFWLVLNSDDYLES